MVGRSLFREAKIERTRRGRRRADRINSRASDSWASSSPSALGFEPRSRDVGWTKPLRSSSLEWAILRMTNATDGATWSKRTWSVLAAKIPAVVPMMSGLIAE
jgi:hypothetical protein